MEDDLIPLLYSLADLPLTQHLLEHAFPFIVHGHGIGILPQPKFDLFLHKKQFLDSVTGDIILPITSDKRYRLSYFTSMNMGYIWGWTWRHVQNDLKRPHWELQALEKVSPVDVVEFEHDNHGSPDRLSHRTFSRFPLSPPEDPGEETLESFWTFDYSNYHNPIFCIKLFGMTTNHMETTYLPPSF